MTNDEARTNAECLNDETLLSLLVVFGFRHSLVIGHSDFASSLRTERSHVLDHIIPELRALDLRRAVHQTRKVVGNAFAFDRAAQSFKN